MIEAASRIADIGNHEFIRITLMFLLAVLALSLGLVVTGSGTRIGTDRKDR